MDKTVTPMAPPPPPPSPSLTTFPVLAFAILGLLTAAILLATYAATLCLTRRRRAASLPRRRRPAPSPAHFAAGAAERRGLEPALLRAIPVLTFTRTGGGGAAAAAECAVCLGEFRDQETLRVLPPCSHAFHVGCIDAWLQASSNCPLCRAEITGAAMASPSEPSLGHAGHEQPGEGRRRKAGSVGDEWIGMRREAKGEVLLGVSPIRRSLSLGSCGSCGGVRWPALSSGQGRGSRGAVLPV